MESTKAIPVLISSSGSPPTGDIIRPTPRRATELLTSSSGASSSPEANEKLIEVKRKNSQNEKFGKVQRKTSSSSSNAFTPINSLPKKLNGEEVPTKQVPERDMSVQSANLANVTNVVVDGNTNDNDSGYQILTSKDEEAERDFSVASGRKDHPAAAAVKGRSSLAKYKAGQTRNKPKRRPPKAKKQNAHFHSDSTNNDDNLTKDLENANRLLDVKAAIEQLKLRSTDDTLSSNDNTSSSSYTSASEESDDDNKKGSLSNALKGGVKNAPDNHHPLFNTTSSLPLSSGGSSSVFNQQQPMRQKRSQVDETHNTTVTSADEFVWIDSYNRLVELQKFPWNHSDLSAVITSAQNGRDVNPSLSVQEQSQFDILPRLSYYLQRALVRIAREAQRLSKIVGKCGKQEVCSALKVVLTPPLATAAVKACLRAAAMFSISTGDGGTASQRQTKSSRAGLLLHVGKMHRWMCLVKVGKFVHEFAAIYLTASIESLLEELVAKCLDVCGKGNDFKMTSTLLEQVVATSSDFWGLFQPYSHLSSCRTAAGLAIPSCLEEMTANQVSRPGGHAPAGSKCGPNGRSIQQALLTTCVGSVEELEELVSLVAPAIKKVWQSVGSGNGNGHGTSPYRSASQNTGLYGSRNNLSWNPEAFRTLYHFVKCSQLEYVGQEGRSPIQVIKQLLDNQKGSSRILF